MPDLLTFFHYEFVNQAIISGIFIAVLCAMLGLFLVLRKLSLIGDGLSHVSLGGIALGVCMGIFPLYIALPVVIIGSLLILRLIEKTRIYGDTAIGIISAFGISTGVILVSLSKGFNIDILSYLFGNILAIGKQEMYTSLFFSVLTIGIVYYFYYDLCAITFDETYAKSLGIKVSLLNTIFFILTAITVTLAVQLVGVMLASALLIIPATTALQFGSKFSTTLLLSAGCAVISVIMGIFLSFLFDLPTGAIIVFVNLILFLLSLLLKRL